MVCMCAHAKSLQSCPSLCNPMDCSPAGSSIHGILQAKILEWVAVPSSRGSAQPRYQTCVFYVSCLAGRFFITSATWEAFWNGKNCHCDDWEQWFASSLVQGNHLWTFENYPHMATVLETALVLVKQPQVFLWKSLSHFQLFETLWAIACQVPLSLELSRPEYWSG